MKSKAELQSLIEQIAKPDSRGEGPRRARKLALIVTTDSRRFPDDRRNAQGFPFRGPAGRKSRNAHSFPLIGRFQPRR